MRSEIAKRLTRQLNSTKSKPGATVDPFAIAFLRKLEERSLGKYLSEEDPGEERRQAMRDLAQFNRDLNSGKYYEEREAKRQAEAEAERQQSMSAGEIFIEAIRKSNNQPAGAPVPLNGAGILRAAVRGLGGKVTISGG